MWLLPPSLPKQLLPADPIAPCKLWWGARANPVTWHGGTRAATWALRPHQQSWTWLPSQPTSKRTQDWLLVRSSMAMSCWWVPGFPKMYDLNGTVHVEGAQLQPQHSNGNTGMDTGSRMQQRISLGELSSCALRARASLHPDLCLPLCLQGDSLALTYVWSTCMPITGHEQQCCSPAIQSQLVKQH